MNAMAKIWRCASFDDGCLALVGGDQKCYCYDQRYMYMMATWTSLRTGWQLQIIFEFFEKAGVCSI